MKGNSMIEPVLSVVSVVYKLFMQGFIALAVFTLGRLYEYGGGATKLVFEYSTRTGLD